MMKNTSSIEGLSLTVVARVGEKSIECTISHVEGVGLCAVPVNRPNPVHGDGPVLQPVYPVRGVTVGEPVEVDPHTWVAAHRRCLKT